jgi:hypothetical protein
MAIDHEYACSVSEPVVAKPMEAEAVEETVTAVPFGLRTSPANFVKHGLSKLDLNLEAKLDKSPPLFPPMSEDDADGYRYLRKKELERVDNLEAMASDVSE